MLTLGVSFDCFMAFLSLKLTVLLHFRITEFHTVCTLLNVDSEIHTDSMIDFH